MALVIHGRFGGGFGWAARVGEFLERSSAVFAEGGRVWLIDPLRADGLDDELAPLGKVAGVVITTAFHDRDVAWLANRYGVPVYYPRNLLRIDLDARVEWVEGRVPDSPLELVPSNARGLLSFWRESAVWWPEQRAMVVGDGLGTADYIVRPGERLAVHPLRRPSPPVEWLALRPERLYVGHGRSLVDGTSAALEGAVRSSRRELLPAWGHGARAVIRRLTQEIRR